MTNLSKISIVDIKLMVGPLCITHLVGFVQREDSKD
jgi:hypothetical protein